MTSSTITASTSLDKLLRAFEGRLCLVVGAAPMQTQYVEERPGDLVVAVNGGISSLAPGRAVDVWVVNSRSGAWESWGAERLRLAALMLEQAKGRRIDLIVFLAREDDSPVITTQHLRKLDVSWNDAIALVQTERHELERRAGGRSSSMEKHALSAGMTAACIAFSSGAELVRLEGFSWKAGYQYAPFDPAVTTRGHEAGDKAALRLLEARYGTRLEHRLSSPDNGQPMGSNAQQQGGKPETPAAAATSPTPAIAKPAPSSPTPVVTKPKDERGFKVRATKPHWYGNARIREGAIFVLRKASHFKPKSMERVDDATPLRRLKSGDVGRQRDMLLAQQITGGRARQLQPNAADLIDNVGTGLVETGDPADDGAID